MGHDLVWIPLPKMGAFEGFGQLCFYAILCTPEKCIIVVHEPGLYSCQKM